MTTPLTQESIRRAPKALLHDHLDGGLRPATIVELAADTGHRLPAESPGALAEWFRAIYGSTPYWTPEPTDQATVAGEPDECVEGLAQVMAAGARFLILNPVFDHLEHLERFASRIGPRLPRASP